MTDLSALDGLSPLAPATGPFPGPGFLGAWWRHRRRGDLLVVRTGDAALALVADGPRLDLAGEADLTDYHSPLGDDPSAPVADLVLGLAPGTLLDWDSLPGEAASALADSLAAAGVAAEVREHDAAMVLALPPDPEEWLAGLDGKQRHEVRRKRRRFADQAGVPTLRRDADALPWFAAMHRRAAGEKAGFMTPEMEAFFADLMRSAGGVIDLLLDGGGTPVGAAFGFEDGDTYYLYNSAFDPDRSDLSPGIVMVTALIDAAIASGRRRFDFLKGGEDYKVRLGATPRALYRLTGRR